MEGEIGRFRRGHLVPVPRVGSIGELNDLIAVWDLADDARVIEGRPVTVGEAFARERLLLEPLPVEAFDTAVEGLFRVDTKSRVCVVQRYYSVPVTFVGRRVRVRVGASVVDASTATAG